MILTQGEKMVWAVAYARTLADCIRESVGETRAKDVEFAVHRAACSVRALRDLEKVASQRRAFTEGIEWHSLSDHEDGQMLRAMLGDEG